MASLIIVYLFLITIQRAVAVLFADFPYTSVLAQQIFGVFMPVLIYYEYIKKEKCIEKTDLKIKKFHIPIVFISGFFMQFFGSFINYPVIILLSKLNFKAPKMMSVPDDFKIIYYIFLICVLPAIAEEILFRKFTFNKLFRFPVVLSFSSDNVIDEQIKRRVSFRIGCCIEVATLVWIRMHS